MHSRKDNVELTDCKKIISHIGRNKIIGLAPNLYRTWVLHAYFSRYGEISLDCNKVQNHRFIINSKYINDIYIKKPYTKVEIEAENLILYEKTSPFNLKKKSKDY